MTPLPTYNWSELNATERARLLERPSVSLAEPAAVQAIVDQVRHHGDAALRELTARFDGVTLADLRIPPEELEQAFRNLDADMLDALRGAYQNIEHFHEAQHTTPAPVETMAGVTCEVLMRPIDAVGLYVPGGTAPLPSTVLMLGVPSRLAGCQTRVLCTPPQAEGRPDPLVLAAAALCGIEHVYCVGGAQAIAAMAYGTETVPKVNKIYGPGNPWVTMAKQLVAQDPAGAGCDLPAGPSEVLVIADAAARADFVAADLLAQAEHGTDSQVVLISLDPALSRQVQTQLELQLKTLPRKHIAAEALSSSRIIHADNLDQATRISNAYAPEHLIINTQDPRAVVAGITNAGSVFLGPWTPESLGDYCSGTNHVLPTHGYATHVSGVGLVDFQKRITIQEATQAGLGNIGWIAERIARAEGLHAHERAVTVRLARNAGVAS